MDNVIIKYSDFFEDDGGFQRVRQQFKDLGEDLIKEAKRIREEISLFDIEQAQAFQKFEEATKSVSDGYKQVTKSVETLDKAQEDLQETSEKGLKISQAQRKSLDELNVTLKQQQVALQLINKAEKDGILSIEDAAKARGRLKVEIKATTQEINKQQKEIIDSNKLSKEQIKLLRAEEVLRKEQPQTIAEIRERLSALRLVQSQINITTEEGIEQNKAFVEEINQLTDQLADNSDKFIQNKINIGNYEESVTSALEKAGLFTTGIGGLDSALSGLISALTLNAEEIDKLSENLKNGGTQVQRFIVQFGRLNKALKASIIGAVILAVSALASAFGDTRAGGARLEKFLLGLQNTLSGIGTVARVAFEGFTNAFQIFSQTIGSITQEFEGLGPFEAIRKLISGDANILEKFSANAVGQFDNIKQTFEDLGQAIDNQVEGVVKGLENIDRAFRIQDEIAQIDLALVKLEGSVKKFQEAAGDDTRSLRERLALEEQAFQGELRATELRTQRAEKELELINEQVKANILKNEFEAEFIDLALEGEQFADAVQARARERGEQLEINNDLIKQQAEAQQNLNQVTLQGEAEQLAIAARRNKVQLDLFEQNLDILLDFIEKEKKATIQATNDTTKNFQDRVQQFEAFQGKFRRNLQAQVQEFEKLQDALGRPIDFEATFDEQGNLELFANGVQLAIDDLGEFNKQVQDLGIGEIPVNRLREVVIDADAAKNEFIAINKQLRDVKINLDNLTADRIVDEEEIRKLDEVNLKILQLSKQNTGLLSPAQRAEIEKQLESLEEEKTRIEQEAQIARLNNQLEALREAEDKALEEGSEAFEQNQREQLAITKQLNEIQAENFVESTKEALDKSADLYDQYKDRIEETLGDILDAVVKNQQGQVEAQERRIEAQDQALDQQRARAEQGLTNTLAFEQKERAREEGELQRRQRRLERLEKIRGLYASFTANSNNPELSRTPGAALAKTLSDFAILEAIAATFGEGGAVEDVLDKNRGIIRGRSHQGRNGGIPVLVEGKEGFFSAREMENLGKENFYTLKGMAGLGPIDRNFFSGQKEDFQAGLPVIQKNDPALVSEIREVKRAIQSKPSQLLNVPEVVDGILRFTETISEKKKVKRNHYHIKKPRL